MHLARSTPFLAPCRFVRCSACAQGPPDSAARFNPLPKLSLLPTITGCFSRWPHRIGRLRLLYFFSLAHLGRSGGRQRQATRTKSKGKTLAFGLGRLPLVESN